MDSPSPCPHLPVAVEGGAVVVSGCHRDDDSPDQGGDKLRLLGRNSFSAQAELTVPGTAPDVEASVCQGHGVRLAAGHADYVKFTLGFGKAFILFFNVVLVN